jgi:hypothetical protein
MVLTGRHGASSFPYAKPPAVLKITFRRQRLMKDTESDSLTTVRELLTLYRMARAISPPGEKGIIVISRFFTNLPKDIGCLPWELGLR